MSIRTTYDVERGDALAIIQEKLNTASNEQLEDVLERLINNKFYNFIIVESSFGSGFKIDRHSYPEENP